MLEAFLKGIDEQVFERIFSVGLRELTEFNTLSGDEVARHLVNANLSGHDSHGVLRLTQYVAEMDRGELAPGAGPELLRASQVCALFDARRRDR